MRLKWLLAGLSLAGSQAVEAQVGEAFRPDRPAPAAPAADGPSHALGVDLFYSSDADETEVLRAGVNLDLRYKDPEEYMGIRLERARFDPLGRGEVNAERVYLRMADQNKEWKWNALIGTDGDTILGAASIHNEKKFRQEYFIEREIVETTQGIQRGIYYTFAGAAFDLPVDDRNLFTAMAGLQEFTGKNLRAHARASYIHVLKPDWGLSGQLRGRYYHSSHPGEFDYYSPRWYAEVLPIVQMRRFLGGWRLSGAVGLGFQRDSESDWRQARFADFRVTSPPLHKSWVLNMGFIYSNTPTASGYTYDYGQLTLGVTRRF